MATPLKTVTDRFSLFKNSRKLSGNKRDYVLASVKNTIESPETQELISLREAFGYYGHGRREMAKRIDIPETMVIMVDNRPVVVENVPSNLTLDLSVDNAGVVKHAQEILATDPGRIVAGLLESQAGGWSWAAGGPDGKKTYMRSYRGMDYVQNPNYISLDHPSNLLESGTSREHHAEMILESLKKQGFSTEGARTIKDHFEQASDETIRLMNLEEDVLLLEGILFGRDQELAELKSVRNELESTKKQIEKMTGTRREMLLEIAKKLPFFVSDEQIDALARMETTEDAIIFSNIFESAIKGQFRTLPLPGNDHVKSKMIIKNNVDIHENSIITFSSPISPIFK